MQKVACRHTIVTEAAITADVLKAKPQSAALARKKITKAWELDERMKFLEPLIESWNRWRRFYLPEGREYEETRKWEPKSAANITLCENLIDFAKEHELSLDMLIACGHKSFERAKYPLGVNMLIAHGLDYYARYSESVRIDLDEDEYRTSASDCWDAELD